MALRTLFNSTTTPISLFLDYRALLCEAQAHWGRCSMQRPYGRGITRLCQLFHFLSFLYTFWPQICFHEQHPELIIGTYYFCCLQKPILDLL
jgi:hypothetical protein